MSTNIRVFQFVNQLRHQQLAILVSTQVTLDTPLTLVSVTWKIYFSIDICPILLMLFLQVISLYPLTRMCSRIWGKEGERGPELT